MRIGVTGEPANDATHLNSPSGILFTREGNNIVADGFICSPSSGFTS